MAEAWSGQFHSLRVAVEARVATVTIDHPPINLFDRAMIGDFIAIGPRLAPDPEVRCVVIESAVSSPTPTSASSSSCPVIRAT